MVEWCTHAAIERAGLETLHLQQARLPSTLPGDCLQPTLILRSGFRQRLTPSVHHVPALQTIFGTSPISLGQCAAWVALGSIPLLVLELRKVLQHSRAARQDV